MAMVNEYSARTIARESAGWAIAFGGLLIILGLFALMAPLIAGVAVTVMLGWLLILGGIAHLVMSWHLRAAGALIWELLIGLAYIVMGIFLLAHPLAGLVALTAFLGAYLLIKGIFELIMWFRLAPHTGRRMGAVRRRRFAAALRVDLAASALLAVMGYRNAGGLRHPVQRNLAARAGQCTRGGWPQSYP